MKNAVPKAICPLYTCPIPTAMNEKHADREGFLTA